MMSDATSKKCYTHKKQLYTELFLCIEKLGGQLLRSILTNTIVLINTKY